MRRASWLVSISITIAALGAGCARGAGDEPGTDAGRPRDGGQTDSGLPFPMDSGFPIGTDSGPLGTDSGPLGTDSGPLGTDSGPVGTDSGPVGCTSALECSDGLACNGTERCEGGLCRPGTSITCDDGIACTSDACVEPGSCAYTPVDSLCGAGQVCTSTGCTSTGTCSESPCRLVSPQCGCATGQACYLSGAARVCAVQGTGTDGAACTSSSSCAPGLDCINFSASGTAQQCTRYCASDADCGGRAGSLCIGTLSDGAGGTIAGVNTCTSSCNPVTGSGCVAGLGCAIYRETAGARRWLTECSGPVGTGTQDAFCVDDTDCARGYACDGTYCLRWCRVGGSDCALGYTCYSLDATAPATIGGVTYGVCDL